MADEKSKKNDDPPDPKTAELTDERMARFTWHPDDIWIVKRNGEEIPPTKLSDLVAQARAEAEAKKAEGKQAEE